MGTLSQPRKPHYYEHDGALQAYANRSFVFTIGAFLFAFMALLFAIYTRTEPPTLVEVDRATGEAKLVSGSHTVFSLFRQRAFAQETTAPSQIEGHAVVRRFLDQYLNYTPASANRAFAGALNMMTGNLRAITMRDLREQDLISIIHDDSISSHLEIRSIEPISGAPWMYNAYGTTIVHRMRNAKTEMSDRLVCRYFIRLAEVDRNEYHPNGLLVAEYNEQQMLGDKQQGLLQTDPFTQGAQPIGKSN
jgi:hypothetical protein